MLTPCGTPPADRFGRKPATMAAAVVFVAGAALMAFAPAWPVLAGGRLVVGLGVGLASMAVPMYLKG